MKSIAIFHKDSHQPVLITEIVLCKQYSIAPKFAPKCTNYFDCVSLTKECLSQYVIDDYSYIELLMAIDEKMRGYIFDDCNDINLRGDK